MATPRRPKVTRLTKIEASRVDGVADPANGFPILMMKSLDAPGSQAGPDGKPGAANAQEEPQVPESTTDATENAVKDAESQAPEGAPGDKPETEVSEVVKSAIAEAVKPLEAANEELRAELAKLKATPIPGGPALTAPAEMRQTAAKAESLAKAAYYRTQAERVDDRELKKYYLEKAAEASAV